MHKIALWASILGMVAFIFDFGFYQTDITQEIIDGFYFIVIALGLISSFIRYLEKPNFFKRKVFVFDLLSVLYTLYVFYLYLFVGKAFQTDLILDDPTWIVWAVILSFIREFSEVKMNYNRKFLNPAQLFILSFIIIILLGTFLLMLPKATHNGISFLNACFTSTSAVCVTGLAVVDTGTYFTVFGQSIILFLIQIGGLGILTFTSYFSYFFKGGTTYENQLSLGEITNSQKMGDVFKTLKYIIIITAVIESISIVLVFFSLDDKVGSLKDQIFFSVFHSISAFCNAGFSTLSNNIYEPGFRYNYGLHLVLMSSFVLGGLGFPIMANIVNYLKHKITLLFSFGTKQNKYRPWMLNINSRITIITTSILIIVGTFLFFIFEYNNTLAGHSFFGKIVTAMFGATTPRTAGFNTVDMTALRFPTVIIIFLLMWIGASPLSTGGGVKTTTFAIASLNILSLAKGKNRIELYRREIADISVRRAFAIITLSLIVLGVGIMLIAFFDPEKSLLNIAFESFSAYSTVGLSLGITSSLSMPSKVVIILIMFIGRVSMLSIIVALFKKEKHKNYRYPTEEIVIN